MPYLVLGNFSRVNTWYMTNISLDEVMIYTPNMDYAIHEIVFIDTEPLTMITSLFPLLNKMCGVVDTSKICGAINKYKGATPLEMKVASNGIDVELVGDDFVVTVGSLSSPENVSIYTTIFDDYIGRGKPSTTDRELKFPVDMNSFDHNEIKTVPVCSDSYDVIQSIWKVDVPMKDGMNMVSIYEYGKKAKQEHASMDVCICKNTGRSMRTLCRYVDSWIKVMSIQPAALWFPILHKN